MKKSLIILTSILLLCVMLIGVGCNKTDATINTSKELSKNLNLLSNTVRRMDTIDNQYLINNELYSLKQINQINEYKVPRLENTPRTIIANSYNVIVEEDKIDVTKINSNEEIKNLLKDEIINRLYCDENGNCKLCKETYTCDENGVCNSCNKTVICDDNGICSTCEKTLYCDDNGNCENCNTNCITSQYKNISTSTLNNLKQISNFNNTNKSDKLKVTKIDNFIEDNDNIIGNNDSNSNNNDYDQENNLNKIIEQNNYDNNENKNTNDLTKQTISTDTAEEDNKIINNNTENIEPILNKTSDNMPAISNEENEIISPSAEEKLPKNNIEFIYYSEGSFSPDSLRYNPRYITRINYNTANSNINRYVDKLQKLYTMTADVVEANNILSDYKTAILNNVDETRTLNNCILTGECTPTNNQIIALNNYISDLRSTVNRLRDCNGNLTNEINKISTGNTGITNSIDVTNSNYLRILNQIDTRISYHENAMATLEQIKYLLEDARQNNNIDINEVEDLNTNLNDDIIINEEFKNNTDTTTSQEEQIENIIITEKEIIDDSETLEETNSNTKLQNEDISMNDTLPQENNELNESDDDIETTETNKPIKNIDTYDNNDNYNLDLFEEKNDIENDVNNQSVLDYNKIDNESSENSENIVNIEDSENYVSNLDNNNSENTNVVNNSTNITKPQMVDGDANLYNNNVADNNSNNYPNSIISQNNINDNDIDNNYYHYDEDGKLYNNTNGFEGNEISNVNFRDNNVNTYKYNTLVDSINRGTIDNGINNL